MFAVIDVETSGLDPLAHRIIECAVVEVGANGEIVSEWSTLIKVPGHSKLGARAIHGINRAMLKGAPRFDDLIGDLSARLRGRIIVGHVLDFDIAHLSAEFARGGAQLPDIRPTGLCTRELARAQFSEGPYNLGACCTRANLLAADLHTALGDARATARLLGYFLQSSEDEDLIGLAELAGKIAWPTSSSCGAARLKPRALDETRTGRASNWLAKVTRLAQTLRKGTIGRLD